MLVSSPGRLLDDLVRCRVRRPSDRSREARAASTPWSAVHSVHAGEVTVLNRPSDPEVILGVALVELLPVRLPHLRERGHEDARHSAVNASSPRALRACDSPLRVELGRLLAEVPDVAPVVLRVPVRCPLCEPTGEVKAVVDRRRTRRRRSSSVRCVTVSTSRAAWPSLTPTYTYRVPGSSGYHGLSTRALNPDAGGSGRVAARAPGCAFPAMAPSAAIVTTVAAIVAAPRGRFASRTSVSSARSAIERRNRR